MLAGKKPGHEAAIGNELCSLLFGLDVLADRIEDSASDDVRFLVLTREPMASSGDRCAVIFPTPDGFPGGPEIKEALSRAGIATARIELCPCRNTPGQAILFLDLCGAAEWSAIEPVLNKVRRKPGTFRLLGFYSEEVRA